MPKLVKEEKKKEESMVPRFCEKTPSRSGDI